MLFVDNYAANVGASTLYILLVGQTVCLQPERTSSLESRPHWGVGRVSLDSGAGSGAEGLPPPPMSVGRAVAWSGVSALNTGAQDTGDVVAAWWCNS